ncbi:MAG TPA: hypothetical protein VFY54_16705 [Rubrobacter sp.]|nr:hypothetical protein [Rubrobacter sp.]
MATSKTSTILPERNRAKAATLASKVVAGVQKAARSMREASIPIARNLFELRLLFVNSDKVPDVHGTSQAYRDFVRENVWDVWATELELQGEASTLNLASFKETVQKTVRDNLDAWVEASNLDATVKETLRQNEAEREASRIERENSDPKPKDALTVAKTTVNEAVKASRKSKVNPTGALDYSGIIGGASALLEQMASRIVGKTDHGITPKQADALHEQMVPLAGYVKAIGAAFEAIVAADAAAKKTTGSRRNPRTGRKAA